MSENFRHRGCNSWPHSCREADIPRVPDGCRAGGDIVTHEAADEAPIKCLEPERGQERGEQKNAVCLQIEEYTRGDRGPRESRRLL